MKTIGHLYRLEGALPGCVSIATGSISANDLYLRMVFEPCLNRFWSTIGDYEGLLQESPGHM